MAEVKDKPEQNMIETLAVRTMAKAAYSTDNIGHYGLAFDYYTHFTSPIRRYPDVMVHRLLQRYLDSGRSVNKEKYEEYCKHSSDMEQDGGNARTFVCQVQAGWNLWRIKSDRISKVRFRVSHNGDFMSNWKIRNVRDWCR